MSAKLSNNILRKLIFKHLQENFYKQKNLNEANIDSTWDKLQNVIKYLGEVPTLQAITTALDDFILNETLDYIIKTHDVPMPNEIGDEIDLGLNIEPDLETDDDLLSQNNLFKYLKSPEGLNEMFTGTPDTSWLAGKYSWKIDGGINTMEAEINTKLPYVAIGDYFVQGEEADKVIDEIHQIWVKNDFTVEQAIKKWASYYLS